MISEADLMFGLEILERSLDIANAAIEG